jgi:hypothetical protein
MLELWDINKPQGVVNRESNYRDRSMMNNVVDVGSDNVGAGRRTSENFVSRDSTSKNLRARLENSVELRNMQKSYMLQFNIAAQLI